MKVKTILKTWIPKRFPWKICFLKVKKKEGKGKEI